MANQKRNENRTDASKPPQIHEVVITKGKKEHCHMGWMMLVVPRR